MILLIDPATNFLERERKLKKPYPHIGLAYIATTVKESGFECRVLDRNAYNLTLEDIAKEISSNVPKLICLTAMTFNVKDAFEVARIAKSISTSIKVVLGGVHATLMPEETLNECKDIDVVVYGEGEGPIKELCTLAENGDFFGNLYKVQSICYRNQENNEIIKNSPAQLSNNYDNLPFPDWGLYDYKYYYKIYSEKFDREIHLYQINTSRGCAYDCTFCSPIHSKSVRFRTANNIVEEIKRKFINYEAKHFDFADSNATFRKGNFMELCRLIINQKLNKEISFSIDTSVNLLDKDILEAAKNAGCEVISLGLESGSDYILEKMKKKYTTSEAYNVIKLSVDLGLKVKSSFILGHPYETVESAYETFNFAKKIREMFGVEYSYNLVDIYPKTELYNMVERNEGGSKWIENMRSNWSGYKRTTPMIVVNDLHKQKLQDLYSEFNGQLVEISGSNFYENEKIKK